MQRSQPIPLPARHYRVRRTFLFISAATTVLTACLESALGPPESSRIAVMVAPPVGAPSLHSTAAETAYASLRGETVFASSQVGFAGMSSRQGRHLRVLLGEVSRVEAFERLAREGTTVGQLYALVGLYLTDTAAYRLAATRLGADSSSVSMQFGCIGFESTAGEVAREIQGGELPAEFRGDSLTARLDSIAIRFEAVQSRAP